MDSQPVGMGGGVQANLVGGKMDGQTKRRAWEKHILRAKKEIRRLQKLSRKLKALTPIQKMKKQYEDRRAVTYEIKKLRKTIGQCERIMSAFNGKGE